MSREEPVLVEPARLAASARRSRIEIWADILSALPRESSNAPGAVPTRVQSAANLPHNRFWLHVHAMAARGLLTVAPLALTPRGDEFLVEAASVGRFLRRFDLADTAREDVPNPPR